MTFKIYCPLCVSATTTATDTGFTATSCEALPCTACRDRNPGLLSVTLRKSRAYELAVDDSGWVRHEDGLVEFSR